MSPDELQQLHDLLEKYREVAGQRGDNDPHYLAASTVYWEVGQQLAGAEEATK